MVKLKRQHRPRLTVYLTPPTHLALRHRALEERVSATRLVERLIDGYLKKKGG